LIKYSQTREKIEDVIFDVFLHINVQPNSALLFVSRKFFGPIPYLMNLLWNVDSPALAKG
jgi:hypothetical protein